MAIAMNRLGGRSNSGEGGEDVDRLYDPMRRSAVKQVASGRFGVTSDYLVNATDIQIKMAQGAKPGEGGQLPAFRSIRGFARTRHSTPGVGLISPPPAPRHLLIEDLAQLHPRPQERERERPRPRQARQFGGVGTVAAGVSKAHADVVSSPGTTAAPAHRPLTSSSTPDSRGRWASPTRSRRWCSTDFAIGSRCSATVACAPHATSWWRCCSGRRSSVLHRATDRGWCIMMRVCHLDTCPVGVATQNPELRKRFTGKPEFVEEFFRFVAADVRRHLAELGFPQRRGGGRASGAARDRVGVAHWKSRGLDLTPVFAAEETLPGSGPPQRRRVRAQDHGLDLALDRTLIQLAEGALEDALPVRLELPVRNVNRTVGTLLGSEVTRRYGAAGLPDDTIRVQLEGSAGQSLGRSCPPASRSTWWVTRTTMWARGFSGGRIVVRPADDVLFLPETQVIAGNTPAVRRDVGRGLPAGPGRRNDSACAIRGPRRHRGGRRPRV